MSDSIQGAPGTTPGPWRAVGWSPRECDIRATVNGKSAQVCGPANTADAHQIAASPLMYAALMECAHLDPDQVNWGRVHKALAAARGEVA